MQVDPYGFLLHLYYGSRTDGVMDYLLPFADRGFSGNPDEAGADRTYSLDVLPQEYPFWGQGDYRSPALIIRDGAGTFGCSLKYKHHTIQSGKYSLPGLPAVYADENEADTLIITLEDDASGLKAELLYGVLPSCDIITRAVRFTNQGNRRIVLERAFTTSLDFTGGDYDVVTFYGRHAMERSTQRVHACHGIREISSRRGMSSHQYNPMLILADRDASEDSGRCWSMQFVYSGSFKGLVETDQFNQTRMQMGLMDDLFSCPLAPGEVFIAPEVIHSFSSTGFSSLSHNLHSCIRKHVCRGYWKDRVRPVLINSWEAAYFDFNADTILRLARSASGLGAELVVMDDGWFGTRNNDCEGLGDWQTNEKKLGCSLKELAERINKLNMRFGIWIEPEMVNERSRLFKEHPDWVLAVPGRKPVRSRQQLVLDFSRKDVVDAVFSQLCTVFDDVPVDYIKWDCNRSVADIFSHDTADQGKVLYDYMLGVYRLLEMLLSRYPHILIEGCSGGGGRFDAGMLYYTPQIWCSDNTDAIDRLYIQYGTSFGYPLSVTGSHVSACPNGQNGRNTPLKTRILTAMAGTFGYELDPDKLSEEERIIIKNQTALQKELAPLIRDGFYYRLTDPMVSPVCAWEIVSEDRSEVLLFAVMTELHGNMPVSCLRMKGLQPGCMYREMQTGKLFPSDALMDAGLPLPCEPGEYHSYLFHFKCN